jgi:hypothetical protein
MMCQEVIELMQRYLDQDLDEIEYNQMLKHLQDCPECTELFQRLLAVSEHLENLPKVTPAFSLVDAILPRLQHMDTAPAATDYGAAGIAALSKTEAAGQQELPRTEKKDAVTVTRLAGWRSRTRGLISARIVGGVVAAGLVFGFFVFDQQEKSNMQNADSSLMAPAASSKSKMSNQEQANKADTFSAAGSSELKAPATAPPAEGNPATEPTVEDSKATSPINEAVPPSKAPFITPKTNAATTASPSNMGSKKIGGSISEGAASQGSTAADSSIPSMNDQAGNASQQQQQQKVTSSVPATGNGQLREPATFGAQQPAAAIADTSSANAAAPRGNLTVPSPTAPGASSAGGGGGASAPVADSTASSSLGEPAKQGIASPQAPVASPSESVTDNNKLKSGEGAPTGAFDSNSSSMKMADTKSLASLDKQYTASVIENRVIIKDKSGNTIFTSTRAGVESDKVILVEWTSDYKLTYQVSNQAGTKAYVINTINKTEANK